MSLKVDDYKTRYKEARKEVTELEKQRENVEVVVTEEIIDDWDGYDPDLDLDGALTPQQLQNIAVTSGSKVRPPPDDSNYIYGVMVNNGTYSKPLTPIDYNVYTNKDVLILEESLDGRKYLLPVLKDDRMKFQLFSKPSKKESSADGRMAPKAFKSKVDMYLAKRSLQQLSVYFEFVAENAIDKGTRSETMNAIMTCNALWDYLLEAKTVPDKQKQKDAYSRLLYAFLMRISNFMSAHRTQKLKIVNLLLKMNLVGEIEDLRDRNRASIWQIEAMIDCDKSKIKDCLKSLGDIVKNNATVESEFLHRMIIKIAGFVDLEKWQELTPIPCIQEMFGCPLEKVPYLKSIVLGKP
eukprot:sb/3466192/